MDSYQLIEYIKNAKPNTQALVYIQGKLFTNVVEDFHLFGNDNFYIAIGDLNIINLFLLDSRNKINFTYKQILSNKSKVPLVDISKYNARIEYGAIIREHVSIDDNAIIMMGAVLNIGSSIGKNTMIDMNAVIGGRAIIGDNCHIGAGSVIAGVIEPPSKEPVKIGNNVFIGANATILEGITIGDNAIVGAGSVVTKDVLPNTVVVGVPAKVIKDSSDVENNKKKILKELR